MAIAESYGRVWKVTPMMTSPRDLAVRIQPALQRGGLSQRQLVKLVGVRQASVSDWVRGKKKPSREHVHVYRSNPLRLPAAVAVRQRALVACPQVGVHPLSMVRVEEWHWVPFERPWARPFHPPYPRQLCGWWSAKVNERFLARKINLTRRESG